jgi:hypothetical protein
MLHIPYRGTAPSVTDLIGGQVDATFTGAPAVLPHVRSGRLRALAVSSAQRIAPLPDVPTVAESGYPGFEADQWYGVVAPAGTPAARGGAAQCRDQQGAGAARRGAAAGRGRRGAHAHHPPGLRRIDPAARCPRWAEVVKAGNVRPD